MFLIILLTANITNHLWPESILFVALWTYSSLMMTYAAFITHNAAPDRTADKGCSVEGMVDQNSEVGS
jgi:hypothetical protein